MIRRLTPYFVAWVITPLVLLCCIEVSVRIFAADDVLLPFADKLILDERNGQFPFVNRAGFSGQVWQQTVNINDQHLRGPNLSRKTKPRLLLIGDSVIFGLGLSDEDAPAGRLTTLLADSVEVLNAGTMSYTTEHQIAFINEFVESLKPDAVILAYCLNDAMPVSTGAPLTQATGIRKIKDWLERHSLLVQILKHEFRRQNIYAYNDVIKPWFDENRLQDHRNSLKMLADMLKSKNIPYGMVVFPYQDQVDPKLPSDLVPQQFIAQFCLEEQLPLLDLTDQIYPEDFLYADPLHLDKRGMKKSLQSIAHFYQTQLITD